MAKVLASLLEIAVAFFSSDAPELFSHQFPIPGRKNDISDVGDIAASLISSLELSLPTIAVQRTMVLLKLFVTLIPKGIIIYEYKF